MLKKQNGITLIALIITIIVMLVLVGVTVNVALNGGLFGKADTATKQTQMEADKEVLQSAVVAAMNDKLEIEKAQDILDNLPNGWEVTGNDGGPYTCTSLKGNIFTVDLKGKIVEENEEKDDNEEIVISSEKDLPTVGYFYNTMYNPDQPELYNSNYEDSENNDKISDFNSSLYVYASSFKFDIPISFFTETIPTEGELKGIITNYDGTTEEITFEEDTIKLYKEMYSYETRTYWTYESQEEGVWGDIIEIKFIPYAKNDGNYGEKCVSSNEYHLFNIQGGNATPFYKLTIFGKTIEFPFNCQAYVGWADSDFYDNIDPVYNDINKVSKVIVNYSNNTKKEYTRDDIFDANSYYSEDSCFYYSSQDNPILYTNGAFIINMPDSSFKIQITSIIVEEDGVATEFNVSDSSEITNSYAWN